MTKLRILRPIWLRRRTPSRRYRPLRTAIDVDVVIVGGGITGAAVAYQFSRAGIAVAVLERQRVALGSTAASTALLMREPDKDFGELADRYGRRAAKRIWQLSSRATTDFVRTLKRLHVRCDLTRRDSVYFTTKRRTAEKLRREFRDRRRAGIACRWLDPPVLKRATGIDGRGAIRTSGNAQLDPRLACLGLLRAAEKYGARIFERSRVTRIRHDRDGVIVSTDHGRVRARQVVVATGYATPEFKPLAGRFRLFHTYVAVTRRLAGAARRRVGLRDVMLWDTERPYYYARWTRDCRLMLGGADTPRLPPARRRAAVMKGVERVRRRFETIYPALAAVATDSAWEGLFAMTPDGLPYIGPHRRYPHHLFALGYGGNGMTFGFLAAKLLLEQYRGVDSADHRLFSFARARSSD